jgi:hypothetical protein
LADLYIKISVACTTIGGRALSWCVPARAATWREKGKKRLSNHYSILLIASNELGNSGNSSLFLRSRGYWAYYEDLVELALEGARALEQEDLIAECFVNDLDELGRAGPVLRESRTHRLPRIRNDARRDRFTAGSGSGPVLA